LVAPEDRFPPAIEAIYETRAPNEPVVLYEGELSLVRGEKIATAPGSIRLAWEPFPRLAFELHIEGDRAFGDEFPSATESEEVYLQLPQNLGSGEAQILGSAININETVAERTFTGGIVGDFRWGNPAATESVIFHVPNFPDYMGDNITAGGSVWAGRLIAIAEGWRIELDSVVDDTRLRETLASRGGYAITHIGRATRTDGTAADFESVADLRRALFSWLSLVRGEQAEPVLFIGLHGGSRVWELWSRPSVAPWIAWRSWLPKVVMASDASPPVADLSSLLGALIRMKSDPELDRTVSRARDWYLQSVETPHTATRVVLAQAGLELMSWLRLVGDVGISEDAFDRMQASDALRIALDYARVPLEVPAYAAELHAATRMQVGGAQELDGPGAVVELRNGTVHPISRQRLADWMVELQGSLLATRYLELLLLHRLGYTGMTNDRIRWARPTPLGGPVRVPWSSDRSDACPAAD